MGKAAQKVGTHSTAEGSAVRVSHAAAAAEGIAPVVLATENFQNN